MKRSTREDQPAMTSLTRHLKNGMIEHVQLQADAARALRGTVAFAVPLGVCHYLNRPAEALFISMTALNLSLVDLRGAYRVRLSILATMTMLAAGSAWLGVVSAGSMIGAVAAMGVIALLGGVWRHLSADYGPPMAVSSALLFLLGLAQPGGWVAARHLAGLVGLGGAVAVLLHLCYWMVRPQHALRYAVAETWVAASDLVAAMRSAGTADKHARSESIARMERELRAALDRTFLILGAAENRRQTRLINHLEEARREVVHFTMRLIAFNTSLEPLLDRPDFARCLPVVDSVLKALSDAARSAAITLIMHRAENFAASNLRLRRAQHLLKVLDEQIAAVQTGGVDAVQVRAALEQIGRVLPRIQAVLRETADHSTPRHVLLAGLPDISAKSVQSLGAWMRPASSPDPVLIRHALRMAVFTMLAVALYEGFGIPRGYWIAFTIMVVLQPDYGSTRQRAFERICGTVAGSVLAGSLLWIKMPLLALDGLAAVTAFSFAYFLKRRYGVAIFFVTINLVLITETLSLVHQDFMVVRVLCTLLGGGLALLAARVFWPVWEGEKFPVLLASAIRANITFLQSMSVWLGLPPSAGTNVLMAKRRAENANRYVSASLERLLAEPAGHREKPERSAALATYNQRVTRALTALAVQLPDAGKQESPSASAVSEQIIHVLENLARTIEQGRDVTDVSELRQEIASLEASLADPRLPAASDSERSASPSRLTWVQLAKTIAEIRAMTLALEMTT